MMTGRTNSHGFTLIEVILVIIIAAILATVAMRSVGEISETTRTEQTKQELNALAVAVIGNQELKNDGTRSDFGYVGDVGAMPPDLDALVSNHGGYVTWNGPYIKKSFSQITDDHKTDAWGTDYSYSGVNITSTGSGSDIVRKLAGSSNELLYNNTSGSVLDLNGTPPGTSYWDSVEVNLIMPNGSGAWITRSSYVDVDGYFSFDSVPIGNHDLQVVYLPNDDTLKRFVSVLPGSSPYAVYTVGTADWSGGGGGGSLEFMPASDSVYNWPQCHNLSFWIVNNTGSAITISSLTLTWSSPTAYYRYIRWDGTTVVSSNNPRIGSGEAASFSSAQTINASDSARVAIESFKERTNGGPNVNMANVTANILLSDGTSFDIAFGSCN